MDLFSPQEKESITSAHNNQSLNQQEQQIKQLSSISSSSNSSLSSAWSPISYDRSGILLNLLKEEEEEEEGEIQEFNYYNHSSAYSHHQQQLQQNNQYVPQTSYKTPPTTPTRQNQNQNQTTRQSFEFNYNTPPSSSHQSHFPSSPASSIGNNSNSFDRTVGSPPRKRKHFFEFDHPTESFERRFNSLPCTPSTSNNHLENEGTEGVKNLPWTWPARGEKEKLSSSSSLGSAWMPSHRGRDQSSNSIGSSFDSPTGNDSIDMNNGDRGRMLVGEERNEGEGNSRNELATRYIRVHEVPKTSTEVDLENLFINRYPSLKGCYTSLLRSHGIVVLVFHDVRSAVGSMFGISTTSVENGAGTFKLLKPFLITRSILHLLNSSNPNPLLSISEGVLLISLIPITSESIRSLPNLQSLLLQYGEIRNYKIPESTTSTMKIFFVEFWDERSVELAMKGLDGIEWSEGDIGDGSISSARVRLECSLDPSLASTKLSQSDSNINYQQPQSNNYVLPPIPQVRLPQSTSLPPRQVESPMPLRPSAPPYSPINQSQSKSQSQSRDNISVRSVFVDNPRMNRDWLEKTREGEKLGRRVEEAGEGPLTSVTNTFSDQSRTVEFHDDGWTSSYTRNKMRGGNNSQENSWTTSLANPMNSTSKALPSSSSSSSASSASNNNNKSIIPVPVWGIYRDEKIPSRNVLQLDRIERGLDVRTTLMLKNIPNRMTDLALMDYIDEAVGRRAYDFFYLRIDFSTECTVGYGFVNFLNVDALLKFAKSRLGTRWNLYSSDKICVASYANIQGKENLVARFKNSSIMEEVAAFRPKIFYSDGPLVGQPEAFPASDDPHRKARSAVNTNTNGLFPAFKPVFKVTQALKGLHM